MNNKPLRVTLLLAMLASGCTTVQQGFVGKEHENVAPFADVTIEFLGAETVDLRDNELIYLRRYMDEDAEELQSLRTLLQRVDNFRDQVIFYSVELVRISETAQSEQAKAQDIADTLESEFREYMLMQVDILPTEFDRIVGNVRSSTTMLGALRAVQPLIVQSGEYFEELVRETEEVAVPAARGFIDAGVEEEFATEIAQLDIIYAAPRRVDDRTANDPCVSRRRQGCAARHQRFNDHQRQSLPSADFAQRHAACWHQESYRAAAARRK